MTHQTHRSARRPILLLAIALAAGACVADGDVLQDDAGSGGVADECTGLERDACADNCVAIWGTPYVQNTDGGWCRFSNGAEFLGCREASSCTQQTGGQTLCGPNDIWRTTVDCIPAEIDAEVCQPPVPDAPSC